jgi:hypothetical protein
MGKIVGITYDLKSDWQAYSGDDPIDAAAELDGHKNIECLKGGFGGSRA